MQTAETNLLLRLFGDPRRKRRHIPANASPGEDGHVCGFVYERRVKSGIRFFTRAHRIIHSIQHVCELRSRNTGVHAAVLAPADVRLLPMDGYAELMAGKDLSRTAVLYPGEV